MREKSNHQLAIVAGSANRQLGKEIAKILKTRLIEYSPQRFSDHETRVEIGECVRGRDVFVIQSTSFPANDNLMELIMLADALKRSDARRISAVVPCFGYARQDRRPGRERTPITAKIAAEMIYKIAKYKRVITVDLHAEQIQGFFPTGYPLINSSAHPQLVAELYRNFDNPVIVSPDAGGTERARVVAKQLDNADLAVIDKRRPKAGVSQVMNILGDVHGRTCILYDDLIDTAGTLCNGAIALRDAGAVEIHAACTHPVLSGPAIERISTSYLKSVIVTDTIDLTPEAIATQRFRTISMASILAETIRRVKNNESVSLIYSN